MSISSNHTQSQMQSLPYTFPKIPNPPGGTIKNSYAAGTTMGMPTFILIHPNKQILEKDIWPISNSILRTAITNAGGVPQSCNPTFVEDLDLNNDFQIYPNPATYFTSIYTENIDIERYEIYSVIGEKISSGLIYPNQNNQIDLSLFNSGYYIIKIYNQHSDLHGVRKFLITK